MTGYKIELRQVTNIDALADLRFLGEIYYDITNQGLAICNGPDVIPMPYIDLALHKMVIPQGYKLTGKINSMRASWSKPNFWTVHDGNSRIALDIGWTTQNVRRALDAVYNRTAPQSLETFQATNEDATYTLAQSSILKAYKTGGNLWVEQFKTQSDIAGVTVSLQNHDAAHHIKGIRFANGESYNPQIYTRGRLSIKGVRKSPYFTGLTVKSKVYYPSAARQDLTFFMLYSAEAYPTRFATRIGWEGNWQTYVTEITGPSTLYGAVAFQFRKDLVLPANADKIINVDWAYDIICGGQLNTEVSRGLNLSSMMMLPGLLNANYINPSFADQASEAIYAAMYGTDGGTKYMSGREMNYVNFATPMLNANYTIVITSQQYVVEIVQKTRYGFSCRSTQAPLDARWKFSYSAKL